MTAATLAHLPLQVGSVALAHAGRAALWVIARYMRSPLTNSAIAALVVTSAMAGSNALYGQRHEHPSPLFDAGIESAARIADVELVIPKTRPKSFVLSAPAKVQRQVAAAAAPVDTQSGPIGNKEVFELQRKLERLQLFTGTIDGYYGPQTARALKKFEELRGLKPTGELTRDIIEMVLAAPLSTPAPQPVAPAPAVEQKPAAAVTLPKVEVAPVAAELPKAEQLKAERQRTDAVKPQSLAVMEQPKPLVADIETGSIAPAKQATGNTVLGRPVPKSPEAALEMAAETAGDAISTIVNGVQSMTMTTAPKALPKKPVVQQLAAESNALSTAEAAPPVALVPKAAVERTELAALPDKPQVGVPLKIEEPAPPAPGEAIAVLDTEATPEQLMAPFSVTDPVIVAKVQRGLGSLGFLHGPADGVAGEATAKAIRNFEVYFNYKVTGRISPELLDLLVDNGAAI
ncbi:MAG TPA: peptidoglycan-binding protein [Devosia sp.]|jgi:peptidoglycan hydrolase-like protein with peptidoglycan-binding domain|uniref:peptidoglycan-binding domain-containing protein n=1 Tax=Devosia sp. TaxID=1871048 RepID=UPI002DDD43C4|nr:peptidoglycan-binding protein [Devosia sp.]HEV2517453.1 peptidoglycan-binding protein [Devosia sp.]